MKLRSTRIYKPRASLRQQSDSYQTILATQRRSSRLESSQHILGSCCQSQSPLKQRPADPQTSQSIRATCHTHTPTLGPAEASPLVHSRVQFREYPSPLQTDNHQTQNRRFDRSIETRAERPPKRARLTEKNLKALEKMGRPRRDPKSQSPHSSSSEAASQPPATSEASTKTISTTDSRFPAQILRNGILEPLNSKRPANSDQRRERLNRSRGTASPTESEYQLTAFKIETAENEQTMLLETSILLKGYEQGYRRVYNQPFSDFPKNVGFNNSLSPAQPDMIEGLALTQYDLFPIREEILLKAAVPSSGPNAITLSHLAGEWKGPGKDMKLARHQAAYDGASMVYARDEACSFLGSPDPTGHAYVQTFTTNGTTLNTFAHYSTESKGQVKYHQYPTSSSFLVSSYEDYKTSRRRLRNLQDDAKEASQNLRDKLNEKWLANQYQSPALTSAPAETVQQHQLPTCIALPTETVGLGDGCDHGDQGNREANS